MNFISRYHKSTLDIVIVYFSVLLSYLFFYHPVGNWKEYIMPVVALTALITAAYFFNNLYDFREDAERSGELILEKGKKQKKRKIASHIVVFGIISIPLPVALILNHPIPGFQVLVYFVGVALAFFYSYPVFNGKRLKNFFLLKNIIASFAWYFSITCLLTLYLDIGDFFSVAMAQSYLFYFFLAYEILWDIKDIDGDRKAAIQTIPLVHGEKIAKIIIYTLLFIVLFLLKFEIGHLGVLSSFYLFISSFFFTKKTPLWAYNFLIIGQVAIIWANFFIRYYL